jgi:hypothetical protein
MLAAAFLAAALVFVWRSFYGMRIGEGADHAGSTMPSARRSAAAS